MSGRSSTKITHFAHRALFSGLEAFEAIVQAGVCLSQEGRNFWSQLDFAIGFKIQQDYPHCRFLLNRAIRARLPARS